MVTGSSSSTTKHCPESYKLMTQSQLQVSPNPQSLVPGEEAPGIYGKQGGDHLSTEHSLQQSSILERVGAPEHPWLVSISQAQLCPQGPSPASGKHLPEAI